MGFTFGEDCIVQHGFALAASGHHNDVDSVNIELDIL